MWEVGIHQTFNLKKKKNGKLQTDSYLQNGSHDFNITSFFNQPYDYGKKKSLPRFTTHSTDTILHEVQA